MQSNLPRVEEVAFDNVVEREVQPPKPPKRKKKKMSFAVWWELHASEELKKSAENIEQQESPLVIDNELIAKAPETVDHKGDNQPPEGKFNEKNQVPFNTWSEEHVPVDKEVSAVTIEKQNESLVKEEESIVGVQETIEKEQPSKSEEQPPTTRRIKKKKIPFHIWLAKHTPADVRTSAETTETTETQDVSPVATQESISSLQETIDLTEKEESFKSCTENINKQDTSLPEDEGDQAVSLKTEICAKETPLVTEQDFSVSKTQETLDQQEEVQPPTTRRIKKKKIPFHIWLAKHAPAEIRTSAETTETQDVSPVATQELISVLQETVDLAEKEESFKSCAENLNKQAISLPEDEGDQADSLKKENCVEETPLVTEQDFSVSKTQETLDQREEVQPPTTRRIKKKKIPFHIWLAKHAPAEIRTSAETTETQDVSPVATQESISVLQETVDLAEKEESFKSCTENINKQDTSLPEEKAHQGDSLKKDSCTEEPMISKTELVTEKKSQKKVNQTPMTKRIKKTPLLWKSFPEPDARVDLTFLTENSDINNSPLPEKTTYQSALPTRVKKTFWKVLPEPEPRIDLNFFAEHIEEHDVSVLAKDGEQVASLEKQCYSKDTVISTARQPKCTCQAKSKEPELGSIELQKYLMRQLDEMFDINRKLNAKLKYQQDLLRKVLSEQRPNRKSTGWGHEWQE